MIIPIRCMNCGLPLAEIWRFYQRRRNELRGEVNAPASYMDGTTVPDTAEKKIFDELNITRYCCKKHLLTNIDLIDHIQG